MPGPNLPIPPFPGGPRPHKDGNGNGNGGGHHGNKDKKKEDPNAWASKTPDTIKMILRQLSANAGQNFMPGGRVGAVRQGPFGSHMQPQKKFDPLTYGQTGGEATFFSQAMDGGVAPLAALMNLGVPRKWDPLGRRDDKGNGNGNGHRDPHHGMIWVWTPNGGTWIPDPNRGRR